PKNPYIDHWHRALSQLLPDYEINTPQRIAAFMAQCAHESGNFVFLTENLNYKAESLMKIFGKYFKDMATAKAYEKKPEKIANRIYANRMGNGDEASGDGYRYRGRGLIQLTGKTNYTWFAASLEISAEVADSARSVIREQVTNGVSVRMAILYVLLAGGALEAGSN
ncbi:MAG: hypothetical protein EBW25_04485, partial [Actinobacteria bacterium]|nr:hypothetical protein [Actinomycetota bacterium]